MLRNFGYVAGCAGMLGDGRETPGMFGNVRRCSGMRGTVVGCRAAWGMELWWDVGMLGILGWDMLGHV